MSATAVFIGQRWQKRTRFQPKPVVRVMQVHRCDREALVEQTIAGGVLVRQRLKFTELRRGYRLVEQSPAVRSPATYEHDRLTAGQEVT